MLVALTGASGFIGSSTAAALHWSGHQVRALVRKTSVREHIQPYVSEWIVGDYADPSAQAALLRGGVGAVIHNALDRTWDTSSVIEAAEKNVMASVRLLEAARLAGVPQFIFVSSVAVYHEIPASAQGRVTEETPAWPDTDYGACKAAVEAYLKAYHFTYSMNASAWRPTAVYGVDPKLPRSRWYELIRTARDGGTIATAEFRKIVHVQDVADALALAVGDEQVSGQFYNLVDGYIYTQVIAEMAREISSSSAVIEEKKGPGPKNQFDTSKAVAFFERHGNHLPLRRGVNGVREYVRELLGRMA